MGNLSKTTQGTVVTLEHLQGGNHHTIRDANRSLILNLIRTYDTLSRADLTRLTGLTRGAVSNIVSRLLTEQLVREISLGRSTGGRRPVMLKMAAEMNLIGAIDVRSRLTTLAVADLSGHFLSRVVISTEVNESEAFLSKCALQLKGMLNQWSNSDRKVLGIGLVVPGIVSQEDQRINEVSELGWEKVSLSTLGDILPWPLTVENDANAVALAERYFGNTGLEDSYVSILLQSDNIGAGLHLDGSLIKGKDGRAGEIAHMLIDPAGTPCSCGNRGCLTTLASSYSLARRYKINMYSRRDEQVEPVTNVRAMALSRAVKLSWDVGTDRPRQYLIYRSQKTPVIHDNAHQVGISSISHFVDHPPEGQPFYYTIVAVDQNEKTSPPSNMVRQAAGPPAILIDEAFNEKTISSYHRAGSPLPQPSAQGLQFGQPGEEHASAMIWKAYTGSIDAVGTVQPLSTGIYDTCGIAFKVQDEQHWFCAVLAYGTELKGGKTLSLIRHTPEGDEWLAFYSMDIESGQEYQIRIQATPSWIRIKSWKKMEEEPDNWQISLRDESGWKDGGVGFRCYGQEALARHLYVESFVSDDLLAQSLIGGIHDHDDPTLQLIMERARQGDLHASQVLEEASKALAICIYNLHQLLGVNKYIFAGPLIEGGWQLLEEVIRLNLDSLMQGKSDPIINSRSMLGRDASLLGAVSVASMHAFDVIPESAGGSGQ